MMTFIVAGAAVVLCALAELVLPGRDLYHAGWFNVLLVALVVVALAQLPRSLKGRQSKRARAAIVVGACGAAIAGFATVASGLLGPDTQTVVAAPGASVKIDALGGSLVFPIVHGDSGAGVLLVRGGSPSAIGTHRFAGPFLLTTVPRDVVAVDASDARGAHLTITQPTGNTFLSPVLLMQTQQTIAGMSLPYDTFAIPAAHHVVKAVLFGPEEAARLPALAGAQNAVLFDVENENEVSLKNGIGVSRDGEPVVLAGVRLTANVFSYPAVRIVSVPDVRVTGLALLLVAIAVGLTIVRRPL
jgi:hypothetical protein